MILFPFFQIDGFNSEEDAFDWERTQYPLKSKLSNTLDPYLKLYTTIVDFQTKTEQGHKLICAILVHVYCISFPFLSVWMDGPMGDMDPDVVENDTGALWRGLYKLEKTFSDVDNPLKMAQKVCRNFVTADSYVLLHVHVDQEPG